MEVQYQRFNSNQGGNCPVTPLPLHLPLPQSLYGRTLGRTLVRTLVRSRDYQIFSPSWVYQNFLPMVLRWRASRAGAPLLRTLDETTVFVASSPMLFGWFESFALQNLQAFLKYEVTNVNVHILL